MLRKGSIAKAIAKQRCEGSKGLSLSVSHEGNSKCEWARGPGEADADGSGRPLLRKAGNEGHRPQQGLANFPYKGSESK